MPARPDPLLDLFVFPCVGGSAVVMYESWAALLPDFIQVHASRDTTSITMQRLRWLGTSSVTRWLLTPFAVAVAAQVRAVQLPGRGSRVKETPVSDLMELAEAVGTAMLPLLGAIARLLSLHQSLKSAQPPLNPTPVEKIARELVGICTCTKPFSRFLPK